MAGEKHLLKSSQQDNLCNYFGILKIIQSTVWSKRFGYTYFAKGPKIHFDRKKKSTLQALNDYLTQDIQTIVKGISFRMGIGLWNPKHKQKTLRKTSNQEMTISCIKAF